MDLNTTFILVIFIALVLGTLIGFAVGYMIIMDRERRKAIISRKAQRSILGGMFSEQLAPFLPDFPKDLKISEARFVGNPCDFIVYKGSDDKNITEVVFVEVKSGRSRFNENERSLRDTIENKRVRWETYRVPDEITK